MPYVTRVDTDLFTFAYMGGSCFDNGNCKDVCCSEGVLMDSRAFNELLKYKDEPEFAGIDFDYPFAEDTLASGGLGHDSRVVNGSCTFRDWKNRGCLIHGFANKIGRDFREIKFFYCSLFPADVEHTEMLTIGKILRRPGYLDCSKGTSTVYKVSRPDIEYYYGKELIAELDGLEKQYVK